MDARLNHEAVENLVTQFSSALDFYRELVQNSIDAGSDHVEVWLEFIEGQDGGEGVAAIHVDDFGEGMDEGIIDNHLTNLFSSAKTNDLTKIGKFGIGFVSVFAMKPKAVLVHTGRSGEYWEILFHEDRSFTKTRVEDPIEGTQITLFVDSDYGNYRELVEGSRATLARWCAHSETEVSFEDRSPRKGDSADIEAINEPFAARGDCPTVCVEAEGTQIALAYNLRPTYGFYNKGLALAVSDSGEDVMGAHAARFSCIGFKIKSRYLEHTLSRETVMRDENFEKAMAMVHAAADGELRRALIAAIEDAVRVEPWTLAAAARYRALLTFLSREPTSAWQDEAVIGAKIFRSVHGQALSLTEVEQACGRDDRVFVAAAPTTLTERLRERGTPVLLCDRTADTADWSADDPVTRTLAAYLSAPRHFLQSTWESWLQINAAAEAIQRIVHPERVLFAVHPIDDPPAHLRELLLRASALLDAIDAGYQEITLGTVEPLGGQAPLFVLGRQIDELMSRPPNARYERRRFEKPHALVNRQHPHFRAIEAIYAGAPAIGTYTLAKSLLLAEDRLLGKDLDLVARATRSIRGEAMR